MLREPPERCRGFRWLPTNVGEPIFEGINAALHGSQESGAVHSLGVLQLKLGLDNASAPRNNRLHVGVQFWVQLDPFVRHLILKPPFVILKKRVSWIPLACAYGLSRKRQGKGYVHNGGLEVVRVDDGRDTSL